MRENMIKVGDAVVHSVNVEHVTVESVEDGIAEVFLGLESLDNIAESLATLFEKAGFKAMNFEYNGVHVTITKENATAYGIAEEIITKLEKERIDYQRNKRDYHGVEPLYGDLVLRLDEDTEIEFKDDEAKTRWEMYVMLNRQNGFGRYSVLYARRWAKYMQHVMNEENKTVAQAAEATEGYVDIDGITGFIKHQAVTVLCECWKYGEELRSYCNRKR